VGEKEEEVFALVVAGDHVRDDYVHLLHRLGLPSAAFARAPDAAAWLNGQAPAVAILEVEDGGCSFLRELRDRYGPDMPAVLVSADRITPADVVAGLLVGADDYAAESMDTEEFLARVRRLIERTKPARSATADLRRLSALSRREREVLTLTTEGLSQKQVAAAMGISIKTVGAHMQNLLVKLGLHSRVEAVALAARAGASAEA
jgi:DNA-binding NarL/FixJ family response regulator